MKYIIAIIILFVTLIIAVAISSCSLINHYYIKQEVRTNMFDSEWDHHAYLVTTVYVWGDYVWRKQDDIMTSPDSIKTVRYKEAQNIILKMKSIK